MCPDLDRMAPVMGIFPHLLWDNVVLTEWSKCAVQRLLWTFRLSFILTDRDGKKKVLIKH